MVSLLRLLKHITIPILCMVGAIRIYSYNLWIAYTALVVVGGYLSYYAGNMIFYKEQLEELNNGK